MTHVLKAAEAASVKTEAASATPGKPGLLKRIHAALVESRMRTAQRQIRAHAMLVNEVGMMLDDIPFTQLSGASALPFNR